MAHTWRHGVGRGGRVSRGAGHYRCPGLRSVGWTDTAGRRLWFVSHRRRARDGRAAGAHGVATGIAGWMFGWLADRSGSLAAPLLTHLAINEAGAVAAVLVQRRSGISTRL
nr:CPBP family intramembrane glutamic endopeptidase [Mycobacterium tuberculosis]